MPEGAIDRQTIPRILSDTLMSGAVNQLSVPSSTSIGNRPVIGRMVLVALILALGTGTLHAGQKEPNKHENRNEIYQLEEVWRDAMLKADTTAMSNLLADDYIAITSAGTLQTKDEAINNLRTHRMHVIALDVADRKIRFYGTTAVVTSLASVEASTPDGDVNGSFRYTRVYVRDAQDKWKIVSFEASRIRQPGEHRRQGNSAQ
jgi:ketosteroid isomerase-like protein